MDTITLAFTLTYFSLSAGGIELSTTNSIYINNHKEFFCISNMEKLNDSKAIDNISKVYYWDDTLVEYDVTDDTLITLPNYSSDYTVAKLDLGRDVEVSWSEEIIPDDYAGIKTVTRHAQRMNKSNLLDLVEPIETINTDHFILKIIPDFNSYNILALKRIGAVITWERDEGNFPVIYAGFSSTSKLEDGTFTKDNHYQSCSPVTVTDIKISQLKEKYLECRRSEGDSIFVPESGAGVRPNH